MFFVLSKTLSYLTQPWIIITGLLMASWIVKNGTWKKRLFRCGVILLLFLSNDFIANEMMRAWEIKPTPFKDIHRTYEYGIILSGVTKSDFDPDDRVYFHRGADRVTHSVQLYKSGLVKKLLVSGGSGLLTTRRKQEADEMADALLLMGVAKDDILIENKSRNTRESALEVKKMLEQISRPDSCLLITSGYHIRRSKACFTNVGWKTDTFSTDFQTHKRVFTFDTLFIPKVDAVVQWGVAIREWVGFAAYWVMGYV
jgi:uncharacterized SAM-binding protein YcdF (DUF218 family)